MAAITSGSLVVASCVPAAPAPPAEAPAEAPAAPAATPVPEAEAPAEAEAALGDFLIGELEGPTMILDVDQFPTSFGEAPMLADMVAAGDLPPVEERLPARDSLMVIQPLHEIGKYGGSWRRAFTGAADGENGNRINSMDKVLFWDYTGTMNMPCVAKGWEFNDDFSEITLFLREGMKWSDGAPFTADDWVFWFEDIYGNPEIVPSPDPMMSIGGEPGEIVKLDDYTVAFRFAAPYPLFLDVLSGDSLIGGGQSVRQARGQGMGAYTPGHYLQQYLPKYSSEDEVNAKAQEEGYDNWVSLLKFKMDWQINPEVPRVGPWRTVQPINTPTWVMERNPYFWAVDTEGNQLPYIDQVVMTLAEDIEVLNLRAVAGELDFQARHIDVGKLPVLLENQEKGEYTVHLDPSTAGSDTCLHVNMSYEADPEVAKWLHNKDFRHALSLGIDRDQLNEAFWLGLGTPGSIAPAESMPENPGPEYRTLWCTYDPDQANQILDSIGLDQKDGEGYRLRTDNGERLRIEMTATVPAFLVYDKHAEMIREQWKEIGIEGVVLAQERSLSFLRSQENETQIFLWSNGGTEQLYLFPRHAIPLDPTESHMGPLFAQWYVTNGAEGKEPPPEMTKVFEMFRAAGSEPKEERNRIAQEIWKILCEEQWSIGVVGVAPGFMGTRVVKTNFGNSPEREMSIQNCRTPGTSLPPTFYFKDA
jgi:peptide/nickel transport system substrate-binding protein